MNTNIFLFLLTVGCFAFCPSRGQEAGIDDSITGIWKGTSVCQVKNSPCHDEIVVYYISKARGTDNFDIKANKIVNGKEEEMGTISCKFDKVSSKLVSSSYGLWTFIVKGKSMEGTLVYKGELYRKIKVSKQQ